VPGNCIYKFNAFNLVPVSTVSGTIRLYKRFILYNIF